MVVSIVVDHSNLIEPDAQNMHRLAYDYEDQEVTCRA
jgi:hypothetical protein